MYDLAFNCLFVLLKTNDFPFTDQENPVSSIREL